MFGDYRLLVFYSSGEFAVEEAFSFFFVVFFLEEFFYFIEVLFKIEVLFG